MKHKFPILLFSATLAFCGIIFSQNDAWERLKTRKTFRVIQPQKTKKGSIYLVQMKKIKKALERARISEKLTIKLPRGAGTLYTE